MDSIDFLPIIQACDGLISRWGAGKLTDGWRCRRPRFGVQPQQSRGRFRGLPLVTVVHQDAIHIEGIILVTVGQRVRAVVRIQLAIGDSHPRVATTAVRAQPLITDALIAMRLDQSGNVAGPVELRNDFRQRIT
ncbi:hypothetical protein D3C81_1787250 [compost metagenome]